MTDSTRITTLLKNFVNGIRKAEGAAAQIVHQHSDPRFIPLYQHLSNIKVIATQVVKKGTGIKVRNVN